jgi:hypothetical protein
MCATFRKVLGSSLCLETGYPDSGFSWFSSVPPGKFQVCILNQAMTASFHILSISSFIYYPFIWSYIVRVTEKALLSNLQINK